jgi:6-phosphogluconolactonase
VIFLGLGEDGHIASLFPDSAALTENEHWVATVYVENLKAHRLTLTLPVINVAAQIIFLVAGQSKSAIVKKLFEADADGYELPAGKVRPANGIVAWLITQDAAGGLAVT